jgi:hypothetical protein
MGIGKGRIFKALEEEINCSVIATNSDNLSVQLVVPSSIEKQCIGLYRIVC